MDIDNWNRMTLKNAGIKARAKSPKLIRSHGDAKRATLWDDTVVERTDAIWVDEYGLVRCLPYELHFIYEAPKNHLGWGLWCTCGSIAGVIGTASYSTLASPNGWVLACLRHAETKKQLGIGEHADGSHE